MLLRDNNFPDSYIIGLSCAYHSLGFSLKRRQHYFVVKPSRTEWELTGLSLWLHRSFLGILAELP